MYLCHTYGIKITISLEGGMQSTLTVCKLQLPSKIKCTKGLWTCLLLYWRLYCYREICTLHFGGNFTKCATSDTKLYEWLRKNYMCDYFSFSDCDSEDLAVQGLMTMIG